jgi:hypothetical protein
VGKPVPLSQCMSSQNKRGVNDNGRKPQITSTSLHLTGKRRTIDTATLTAMTMMGGFYPTDTI